MTAEQSAISDLVAKAIAAAEVAPDAGQIDLGQSLSTPATGYRAHERRG